MAEEATLPGETTVPEAVGEFGGVPVVADKAMVRYDEAGLAYKPSAPARKGEEDIEHLPRWQQKAFWLLYAKEDSGMTLQQISQIVKVRPETICRFGKSALFRRLAKKTGGEAFERLAPLALRRLKEILSKGKDDRVVSQMIVKVLDESGFIQGLKDKAVQEAKSGDTFNIQALQIVNGGPDMLKALRKKKAQLKGQLSGETDGGAAEGAGGTEAG
jgi:hypothetical protein